VSYRAVCTVVQVKTASADPNGDVIALAIDAQGHKVEWRTDDCAVGDRFVVSIEPA
jgi:hypothetical protein